MNWFKKWMVNTAIDYAASQAKELLTVENLASFAADNITKLLGSIVSDSFSVDSRAKLCSTVKNVALICSSIADVLQDGQVTVAEVTSISSLVADTCAKSPLTDEVVAGLIDKLTNIVKDKVK